MWNAKELVATCTSVVSKQCVMKGVHVPKVLYGMERHVFRPTPVLATTIKLATRKEIGEHKIATLGM